MRRGHEVYDSVADVINDCCEEWRSHAPCAGRANLFFPDPKLNPKRFHDRAVRICESCPVWNECQALYSTLPLPQRAYGVWFGQTPEDRGFGRTAQRKRAAQGQVQEILA